MSDRPFSEILGNSRQILSLQERLKSLVELDVPILVSGEPGTGKDLTVDVVSRYSDSKYDLLKVSCEYFQEELNHISKKYAEKTAQNLNFRTETVTIPNPIYFDGVDSLESIDQGMLLKILNENIYQNHRKETVEFKGRLFFSAGKELFQKVKDGKFRDDLYQKLSIVKILLPSLKEIKSDIPIFVNYYTDFFKTKYKKNITGLSDKLIQFLLTYDWPGNTGQLVRFLEGVIILSQEKILDTSNIPDDYIQTESFIHSDKIQIVPGVSLEEYEKKIIMENLKFTGGNRDKTAKLLGISERTLYRKLREYGE